MLPELASIELIDGLELLITVSPWNVRIKEVVDIRGRHEVKFDVDTLRWQVFHKWLMDHRFTVEVIQEYKGIVGEYRYIYKSSGAVINA